MRQPAPPICSQITPTYRGKFQTCDHRNMLIKSRKKFTIFKTPSRSPSLQSQNPARNISCSCLPARSIPLIRVRVRVTVEP